MSSMLRLKLIGRRARIVVPSFRSLHTTSASQPISRIHRSGLASSSAHSSSNTPAPIHGSSKHVATEAPYDPASQPRVKHGSQVELPPMEALPPHEPLLLTPHEMQVARGMPPQHFFQRHQHGSQYWVDFTQVRYVVGYRDLWTYETMNFNDVVRSRPWKIHLMWGFFWFWMVWHWLTEPEEVFGEFVQIHPSKFTDEELGIPPDDYVPPQVL